MDSAQDSKDHMKHTPDLNIELHSSTSTLLCLLLILTYVELATEARILSVDKFISLK